MELDGADVSAVHVEVGAEGAGAPVGTGPVEGVVGAEEEVALVATIERHGAEGADELYVLVFTFHSLADEGFVAVVDDDVLELTVADVVVALMVVVAAGLGPLNNIRCASLDFFSGLEVETEGAGGGVEAGLIRTIYIVVAVRVVGAFDVEFHQRSISDKVVESVVFEVEGQAEGIPVAVLEEGATGEGDVELLAVGIAE